MADSGFFFFFLRGRERNKSTAHAVRRHQPHKACRAAGERDCNTQNGRAEERASEQRGDEKASDKRKAWARKGRCCIALIHAAHAAAQDSGSTVNATGAAAAQSRRGDEKSKGQRRSEGKQKAAKSAAAAAYPRACTRLYRMR